MASKHNIFTITISGARRCAIPEDESQVLTKANSVNAARLRFLCALGCQDEEDSEGLH